MRKYSLLLLLAACAVWIRPARPAEEWKVGILDGYRLFSIAPSGGAPGKAIDLRQHWPRSLFFRPEKQGETYPSVSILASSPEDGRFLANLWGLANRADGPLVLGMVRTGDVLRTLAVSGDGVTAAFVPPDNRRIAASWSDANGDSHTAIFDASTGKAVAELPAGRLPASRFLFAGAPARLVFLPESSDGKSQVELLPTDSWRDGKRLALPAENAAVLDLRDDTILLETRDATITVSAWAWTRPGAAPVVISNREYGGSGPVRYRLASHGQRVLEWSDNAATPLVLYDSATGRATGRIDVKGRVRAFAVDSSEKTIAFAVGEGIAFVDASDGRVISRTPPILSARDDVSLFWFR